MEGDLKRAQDEIERLEASLVELNNVKVRELEEQRKKLEQSNQFHADSLRQSTENKINILTEQLNNKKQVIQNKDSEIKDIASKYDKI